MLHKTLKFEVQRIGVICLRKRIWNSMVKVWWKQWTPTKATTVQRNNKNVEVSFPLCIGQHARSYTKWQFRFRTMFEKIILFQLTHRLIICYESVNGLVCILALKLTSMITNRFVHGSQASKTKYIYFIPLLIWY